MRFSQYQIRFIRRLVSGSIPLAVWRKWDQRPIRALFLRRIFTLTKQLDAEITQIGWDSWSACTSAPKTRNQPTASTFVDSNDLKRYKHLRKVN